MKKTVSRRDFMAKGAAVLGAAAVFELTGGQPAGATSPAGAVASGAGEVGMPHISVKLWPGRSEEDKQRLANAIVENLVDITGCSENSVSVTIEEVPSAEWKEQVYDPDIRAKQKFLYKKPGYSM